ncbi:hypothetical protein CIJ83_06620 [Neisseria meningitidis]|nr:hypothetical protein CIJ81_09620 [Neisseria meningitidis]RGA49532.1 hypothetical protein CIJ85_10050 [Neisseria meningitidis]RGA67917.1 hypothetical protein CIJ71_05730 [Neisseria meningitidis]RGA80361.1 hypothetical protein CIJ69_09230 [Neisseria meningitidis]RGA87682.1 hypothetical protein CIJ66_10115 [Neisseria meningitidis]
MPLPFRYAARRLRTCELSSIDLSIFPPFSITIIFNPSVCLILSCFTIGLPVQYRFSV